MIVKIHSCIMFVVLQALFTYAAHARNEYCFAQSADHGYSAALATLDALQSKRPVSWQSWEESLGGCYEQTYRWHDALIKCVQSPINSVVKNYFIAAQTQALVRPYCFIADGKSWFASYEHHRSMIFFPAFLEDITTPVEYEKKQGGIQVPLVCYDDKTSAVYDHHKTKKMIRLKKKQAMHNFEDCLGNPISESAVVNASHENPVQYRYNVTLQSFAPVSGWPLTHMPLPGIGLHDDLYMVAEWHDGIREVAYAPKKEFSLDDNNKSLRLTQLGLYKVLLTYLGYSFEHKKNMHTPLTQQLRTILHDVWHPIDTHIVLEVAIADLLLHDAALREQARVLVDVGPWHPYATYQEILHDCNAGRLRLAADGQLWYERAKIVAYLPGEVQFLAYHITQLLQLLWYAHNNEELFYSVSLPKVSSTIMQVYTAVKNCTISVADWSAGYLTKQLFKQQTINGVHSSFIKLWHELLTRIKLNHPDAHAFLLASSGDVFVSDPAYTQKVIKHLGIHENLSTWESFKAHLPVAKKIKIINALRGSIISPRHAGQLHGPDVRSAPTLAPQS